MGFYVLRGAQHTKREVVIPQSPQGDVGYNWHMHYVYILESTKDSSSYIGTTSDLKRRLQEHNSGSSKYSSHKAPFIIIWYCAFQQRQKAYAFETYLKSSSGHAFRSKRLI